MTTTRRLAAILAADVAGYSRMMGADEEGTLERLKAHRRDLIDPMIAEHRGRIVKTTGDGILIEFPSVVDAVRCAVDVQKAMTDRNAGEADDRRIEFRVGINLGDVIIDGDDIHGDGVNIAARLESLADPGGICVSSKVRDEVGDKLDMAFEDLGEQSLKNIAKPVRLYRIRSDERAAPRPTLALPDKPSIAVLPFQNMSGDPEQEFFSDGMAEDIITALSKLRSFFVISRNSTFAYKGKSIDVRQVARELGVRYVLEGSVRKAGNRLRITAQLIDATSGNHIWAQRYDRDLSDIFALQDEITQSVVGTIEPQLYAAENIRIQTKAPESLDAWECVIRALWYLGLFTADDNERARQLLRRAVELSPGYAKAHSLLAHAEIHAVARGNVEMDAAMPVAELHARTGLSLDDSDPWAFSSIGMVDFMRSRHAEAIASLRQAINLNPNFAMAYGCMGGPLVFSGDAAGALEAIGQALRMSPRDPYRPLFSYWAGVAHFVLGNYAEGAACECAVLRERPHLFVARRMLAACYVRLGKLEEARAEICEVL
ncbi:MAG TPA: adenylate/guanylate cyclase domain-containing protein, partial [Stellaceae bacterium]|nr:adenylate/guanylate cyclase domain-containing protein [Stellaceae bacterium]